LISKEKMRIELVDEEERTISSAYAYIAIDATIDELGIMVISFKKGLWRHINDPPTIIRKSIA